MLVRYENLVRSRGPTCYINPTVLILKEPSGYVLSDSNRRDVFFSQIYIKNYYLFSEGIQLTNSFTPSPT